MPFHKHPGFRHPTPIASVLLAAIASGIGLASTSRAASSAPAQPAAEARLLSGPVVFRLPARNRPLDASYAMVFRLDRDPVGLGYKGNDGVEPPYRRMRGTFSIGPADASIYVPKLGGRGSRVCITAYAQDVSPFENEDAIAALNRVRTGRRVDTSLTLAVDNGTGGVEPSRRTYTKRPRLRHAQTFRLNSKRDQRALRTINCDKR